MVRSFYLIYFQIWFRIDSNIQEALKFIHSIIDLRQDMLTIQILKLMDIIWKNEGIDMK